MKHILMLLVGGSLSIVLAVIVWGAYSIRMPMNRNDDTLVLVRVEEGNSVAAVTEQLAQKGLIRSPFWFRVAVRLDNAFLLPGLYHFSRSESMASMIEALGEGSVSERQVTIREGLRREELAELIHQSNLEVSSGDFLAATKRTGESPALRARIPLEGTETLEGFLFPDTYRFAANGLAVEISERLVENFLARTADLTLTYDDVILASIIEREAKFDEDRALIAGVYKNRLDIGMKLDADPTVQYAKADAQAADCFQRGGCAGFDWWPTLVVADYQGIDSPLNTYRNKGLPPAPICNPGLASLKAAVAPEDHDYVYFLSDADGKAHFAKTLAEHNKNKVKYLP